MSALNAAYLSLLERKESAWFQLRLGPTEVGPWGLLQPIADGIKLVGKQIIIPDGVDKILFRIAPVMISVPAIMNLATIPFSETIVARNINLGLVMVLSFTSFNVMGIMLGGWASRNKYSVISSARVVAQNVAYEIPMFLIAISLVMVTHTFDLRETVLLQSGGFWNWNLFKIGASPLMPVACLMFFVCLLAETNRSPFDMMEAESELIAGAITEYSGMGFGLFFISEYANILVGSCLRDHSVSGRLELSVRAISGPSLVPHQNVLHHLCRDLDPLVFSKNTVLRSSQSFLENPDPPFPGPSSSDLRDGEDMVGIVKYFREITLGLYSLAVGMGVTFRNMFHAVR